MANHQLVVASYYARPQGSKHLGRKYFHDHYFHVESSIFPMVIYNYVHPDDTVKMSACLNKGVNLRRASQSRDKDYILKRDVHGGSWLKVCLLYFLNL